MYKRQAVIAHFVDIPGAQALLAGGQPLARRFGYASEVRLELHHPRPVEEQRFIQASCDIERNERSTRVLTVSLRDEEVKVFPAQLLDGHGQPSWYQGAIGVRSGMKLLPGW